jgi:hypothetical protein
VAYRVFVLGLGLSLITVASEATAQRMPSAALAGTPTASAPSAPAVGVPSAPTPDDSSAGRAARWAPLASLVVPGLGQALLKENRALGYVVTEVYALLEFSAWRTEARRRRTDYRRLAADVAGSQFSTDPPVGPFSYYETMRSFTSSGAFDRVPGGGLDPELDESTFNGRIWRLARETYWADPDEAPSEESVAYRSAVGLYIQRAVLPEFAWSWRDASLEFDLYRLTIQRSNTAFRRAQEFASVLLANHLLSMVDAIATVRVQMPDDPATGVWSLHATVPWPRGH